MKSLKYKHVDKSYSAIIYCPNDSIIFSWQIL